MGWITVLLVMFNKAALSSYKFPSANVITVLQVGTLLSTSFILEYLSVRSYWHVKVIASHYYLDVGLRNHV